MAQSGWQMTDQELNEAVAKKLGYRPIGEFPEFAWAYKLPGGMPNKIGKPSEDEMIKGRAELVKDLPDYCTSLDMAQEIVDKVGRSSLTRFEDGRYFFCFGDQYQYSAEALTAPKAICLAFLKLPQ